MTPQDLSAQIKRLAAELGFERCGIAAAAALPRGHYLLDWLASGRAGSMNYIERHLRSRLDLRTSFPFAKSVIVVALNYKQPEPAAPDDEPRGNVAMYAWGEDYHAVIREKLEQLVVGLRARLGTPFEAKVCVDTSAIVERELAAMAGVGWIGKNTLVIHPDLGSYFFLGEILTSLEIAPDEPEPDHCGSCTRCLDACPTEAFPSPYEMDARRCIAYLTIEHRGEIPGSLAPQMGDWVFGCDICQEVCPHNRAAPSTREPRFLALPEAAHPSLHEILGWDEALYSKHVEGRAVDRAGRMMWKRNAEIALRNIAAASDGPPDLETGV